MNKKIIITVTILICLCAAIITARHFSNINREESTAQAVLTSDESFASTADNSETLAGGAKTEKTSADLPETTNEKTAHQLPETSRATEKPATVKTTLAKPTAAATAQTSQKPTKPTAAQSSTQKQTLTVTFSINAETASAYGKDLPRGGIILAPVKLSAEQGETAFSLLEKICEKNNIALKYQSKSYIQGIGGLSEKDCGAGSGWMYRINGEKPLKPANKYTVLDGDIIEWYYVTSPTD